MNLNKSVIIYIFLQQENKQSLVKMLGDVKDDMVHNIFNHLFYEKILKHFPISESIC